MPRQTLQLPVTLPSEESRRRFCARCIEERLHDRPGVFAVRVIESVGAQSSDGQAIIELDYDADLLSLHQVNAYLREAGGCLHESLAQVVLPVVGIVSSRQEAVIADRLQQLPGLRATASYAARTIRIEFDRRQCALPEIVRLLAELGVEIRQPETTPATSATSAASREALLPSVVRLPGKSWVRSIVTQPEMLMAILAGVFLLVGAIVHWTGGNEPLRIALLLVSYVCGGFFPAQEMVRTLARLRLDIDLLMFAAAFGAAALGHYEEGAMLLFLFSLGGAGEELAMSRARNAIEALTKLSPKTAVRLGREGAHEEVLVEDLRIDDWVFVAPGQLVPADGAIIAGRSAINQAAITGESMPVEKTTGDSVFAGTLNGDGALTVQVQKLASDNTLAKVIRLVHEAQTTKSPTQLFTDKVEAVYVPMVIVATVLVMTVPPTVAGLMPAWAEVLRPNWFTESPWKGWFYQSMAFLTAASPCALAIGTPAAILSGIGRAARGGVLIKGGIHLENLGQVRAIAFDKTGTLTVGRPMVTHIETMSESMSADQLLTQAAAIERGSKHPLASAIVDEAKRRGLASLSATNVQQTPGVGIRGWVDGEPINITRPSAIDSSLMGAVDAQTRCAALEEQGCTVVLLSDEKKVLGLIALMDQPRDGAREALSQLKRLGIRYNIMLTGDNARTAAAIGSVVGVDEHLAELLPEDKLTRMGELSAHYGKVAMVGDGVNDAPALAKATVGIAIGGASGASDVALETADVALLSSDLRKLPEAVGISRFTRRIIQQNLILALGVIAIVSPLAALGFTNIALAVMLHEGSTVLVVLNALRILRYRRES